MIRNDLGTAARLDAVRHALRARRYPSPGIDALSRLLHAQLGVTAVAVVLLDDAHQHVAAASGPATWRFGHRVAAHSSRCHRVLVTGEPHYVDDVAANDVVPPTSRGHCGLSVRAFAGHPLATSTGFVLGVLCAVDEQPRAWSRGDREVLRLAAEAAAAELELRSELAWREDQARLHDASLEHEGMLPTAPAILGSITDAFLALDREWRFTWANAAAHELFGESGGPLAGRRAEAVFQPDLAILLLPQLEAAVENGAPFIQDEPVAIDSRWFAIRAYPAKPGISVFLTDVTSRVDFESALSQRDERLRQAQKMEAIGLLTGGVAHDFNNLLTVIQGNADVLAHRSESEPPEEVIEIQRATERAARLTRQLLAFSRKQVLQPRVLDPNRVIGNLLPMLRRLILPDIRIDADLAHPMEHICCDPGQLEQVIMNLVVNARDAMPSGGTLRLITRVRTIERPVATHHAVVQPGRWICLSVADTGPGIPPDVMARIFEPFFTTKDSGTGLGLATVYGIVQQSGGAITVRTGSDGTRFTIWFSPVAAATDAGQVTVAPECGSGSGTVLVVDDEPGVRLVMERTLRGLGYTVIAASDGAEAILRAREWEGAIDLVLSDVAMPGMGGVAVLDAMRVLRPEARRVLMSGFTVAPDVHQALARGDVEFLQKPFTRRQIADLARPRSPSQR